MFGKSTPTMRHLLCAISTVMSIGGVRSSIDRSNKSLRDLWSAFRSYPRLWEASDWRLLWSAHGTHTPYTRASASWFPYTIAYAPRALLQPAGDCAIERNSYGDRPANPDRSIDRERASMPGKSVNPLIAWIALVSTRYRRSNVKASVCAKFISHRILHANLAGFTGRR